MFQENKARQVFQKRTFFTPCYAHFPAFGLNTERYGASLRIQSECGKVRVSGGKKCSFFGNFDVLCFLETPVLGFSFLTYYRRNAPIHSPEVWLGPPQTSKIESFAAIINGYISLIIFEKLSNLAVCGGHG